MSGLCVCLVVCAVIPLVDQIAFGIAALNVVGESLNATSPSHVQTA